MSATFYNGTSGDFLQGSTAMNISGWKLTEEATELDTTTVVDGGDYNMITGRKKRTASIEIMYDATIHGVSVCPIKSGTTGTFKLERYDADTNPFSGTGYITKVDLDHSFDTVMKATLDVTFSGAVTGFLS